MKTNMNIERNPEVMEVLAVMAEVKKKFYTFASQFNDEDMEDICHKVSSRMNECIIELTALDNYIYTNDVVNWTEGETKSTVEMTRA